MSGLTSAVPLNTIGDYTVNGRTCLGISTNCQAPTGEDRGSWDVIIGVIDNLLDNDPPFAAGVRVTF